MSGNTIWKFNISENGVINAPVEKFLSAQFQGEDLCVWAEVDRAKDNRKFAIEVIGTGDYVPENANYIGTVQQLDGMLIWHIYWREYNE